MHYNEFDIEAIKNKAIRHLADNREKAVKMRKGRLIVKIITNCIAAILVTAILTWTFDAGYGWGGLIGGAILWLFILGFTWCVNALFLSSPDKDDLDPGRIERFNEFVDNQVRELRYAVFRSQETHYEGSAHSGEDFHVLYKEGANVPCGLLDCEPGEFDRATMVLGEKIWEIKWRDVSSKAAPSGSEKYIINLLREEKEYGFHMDELLDLGFGKEALEKMGYGEKRLLEERAKRERQFEHDRAESLIEKEASEQRRTLEKEHEERRKTLKQIWKK
jgi:F0F1-type ATP synthase assembly protein I